MTHIIQILYATCLTSHKKVFLLTKLSTAQIWASLTASRWNCFAVMVPFVTVPELNELLKDVCDLKRLCMALDPPPYSY